MKEKMKPEVPNDGKHNEGTWFTKQSCGMQFCLIFLPAACLLVATIVLGIFLSDEMSKNVVIVEETNVCKSSSCVALAGDLLANMNQEIDPCVDFYQYTCGGYERQQNIPSGYGSYGAFTKAGNLVQKDLRDILENEAPPVQEAQARRKARRFYKSCLDTDTIDARGLPALQDMLTKLGGFFLTTSSSVPADWNLLDLLDKRNNYTLSGLFSFYVGQDYKDVSVQMLEISQGGLGLGSGTREYYINPNNSAIIDAYAEMLTSYATLIVGETNVATSLVRDVVDFEAELAAIQMPNSELRDTATLYNKLNISDLEALAPIPDFTWLEFFANTFKNYPDITIDSSEPVLVMAKPYIEKLSGVLNGYLTTPEKMKTIQNYIVFRAISKYAPSFGSQFQAVYEKFQGVFSGQQGSLPRWQTCVKDTDDVVGFGLGAIYIDDYFTQQGKVMAEQLIEDVTAAFRARVEELDWMDDKTKVDALAKVDALKYEAAYPHWLTNETYLDEYYAKLMVNSDYVNNTLSSYSFTYDQSFSVLRKPPNPDVWYMNPQTVNAYYSSTQNKFVVPAGILTPPFFYLSSDVPNAVNYAAIGTVVGHEIGHGFDDSGSQFDGEGNLNNWWTNDTLAAFTEKGKCLIDQYEKYEVDGMHLDGKHTLGENIGDNGGLRASYQAYDTSVNSQNRKRLVGLDLTPEQLFFVSYAQVWCSLYTDEAMELQITQNEHSPGPFRVIGPVSNSPEFAQAFQCKTDAPMNPPDKCTVW